MKPLRVVQVKVRNVLGALELDLEPGRATIVSGQNATGKSTALKAVQAALGGGSLAKLAHIHAEDPPEVVLVLEGDDGEHYRVRRNEKGVEVRQRVGDSRAMKDLGEAPQAWLSGLFDRQGANPVRFLQANDRDRAKLLLEALPLELDRPALLEAVGLSEKELAALGPVPAGIHALEELALVRERVFTARTGVNRDLKQQKAAIEQLERKIPAKAQDAPTPQAVEDLQAAIELASGEREAARTGRDAALAEARRVAETARGVALADAKRDLDESSASLRADHESRAAKIRAAAEAQIRDDLAATQAAIDGLAEAGRLEVAGKLERIDSELAMAEAAARDQDQVLEAQGVELQSNRERLAALQAEAREAAAVRALEDQVEDFARQRDELDRLSKRYSRAIRAADAFRFRLTDDLPIADLELEADGSTIRVGGVLWDQLNTATQTRIAVQVASMRARELRLPLVFVDGAEALDSAGLELLLAELERAEVQAFVARVTDEPGLHVEARP